MNKQDRNAIKEVLERLQSSLDDLIGFADDERNKFEILPKGIKASEHGLKMEASAENLEGAVSSLEECLSYIEGVISS